MSFDTKYRPPTYDEVLGQQTTIKILRQFIIQGTGFHQSYLFSGPHGSGKTTLGRILARALLCESPVDGNSCDECSSCKAVLSRSSSDFLEVDAATQSGKADIKRITEEIQFSTFTGNRRLYLFDEAHQLSPGALDALLNPLEESDPDTGEKRMVCIFCTTEPGKMKDTILSRCAPAFVVKRLPPEVIAKRLGWMCEQEGIDHDPEVLRLIAEVKRCHLRDTIKALESVSKLGAVSRENVWDFLHLGLNERYLEVLEGVGTDLKAAMAAAEAIMEETSPLVCYRNLAELSMLAWKASQGYGKVPIYWSTERVTALGQRHGESLLAFADRFSQRPGKPLPAMVLCDLGALHHGGGASSSAPLVIQKTVVQQIAAPAVTQATEQVGPPAPPESRGEVAQGAPEAPSVAPETSSTELPPGVQPLPGVGKLEPGDPALHGDGTCVFPKAVKALGNPSDGGGKNVPLILGAEKFCWLLGLRVRELCEAKRRGSAG